ncbi:hypothetical protein SDC9_131447 [bioreactor metagenome]|uniref:Uncharacterized protein n=1 Tax=bioreactor metagenome TaxID=1076179 RepID=A0A645D4S2_9ZZZZ
MAHRPGLAVPVEEIGTGRGVVGQVLLVGQQRVQARADLEAVVRQIDGRFEQLGPGQLAMFLVRKLQHAHGAGHAD